MELFEERVAESGLRKAKWLFIWDVLKLFRPGIIRNFEGQTQLNNYGMFRNYIKVGLRSLNRQRVFSILNITGLSLGIACLFLILLYVNDELSYDKYHENYDRIYRVVHSVGIDRDLQQPSAEDYQVWGNATVGPALHDDFPGIEKVFRFTSEWPLLFDHNGSKIKEESVVFADPTIFEIFSWDLVSGNSSTALEAPNSIVLTRSIATKLYGDENPVGKSIEIIRARSDESLTITGVMDDIPSNSHFKFNCLISMSTLENMAPRIFKDWNYWDFYTYLLVDEELNMASLNERIPDFLDKHVPDDEGYNIDFEPLSKAYFYSSATRQPGAIGNLSKVYIFFSIGIFIIVMACVNFTNLSTARSMERAKEVGIRKSIGALKGHLMFQFLSESMIISIVSTIVGLGLTFLMIPIMRNISGKDFSTSTLFSQDLILIIIGVVILIGLIAGGYPALVLTKYQPHKVLKGKFSSSKNGLFVRKSLIVFQFTLSIVLIVGTYVVFNQMKHVQSHDLGFDQEQMVEVNFEWHQSVQDRLETLKNEFKKRPDVVSVSASRTSPGGFFLTAFTDIDNELGEQQTEKISLYEVGMDFIDNYKIELVAGRAFSNDFSQDSTQALIVNEASVKAFGFANPEDIIGRNFSQWGRTGKVIGVVRDFNFKSLHSSVEPLALRIVPASHIRMMSIRVKSDDIPQTLAELKGIWDGMISKRPFHYNFLEDTFNAQYKEDLRFGNIFNVFTGVAIFITCLGLFGLTTYSVLQRTKEIGVRKVLGASVSNIVLLLSSDIFRLFAISTLFAIPISWYTMNIWLSDFAYRIGIGVGIYTTAICTGLFIAIISISWQAINAALVNPVNSLKDE